MTKRVNQWFDFNKIGEGGFDDGRRFNPPYCPNNCWMTLHGKRMRKRCRVQQDPHDKELYHLQCPRCKSSGRLGTAWVVKFR